MLIKARIKGFEIKTSGKSERKFIKKSSISGIVISAQDITHKI